MPAIPWKTFVRPEPEQQYLVLVSRLPLRSYLRIPRFVRLTFDIQRQLSRTEGLLGYSLLAQPLGKTFWTLSAWQNQQALDAFVAAAPHSDVMRKIRPFMLDPAFHSWSARGDELPPTWHGARQRLSTMG